MSCVEYIWRYLWLSPPHGQGDQTDRCLQHDSNTQIICIAEVEHTPRNLEAGGRGFKSCRVLGFFLLLLSLLSVSFFYLFLLSLIRCGAWGKTGSISSDWVTTSWTGWLTALQSLGATQALILAWIHSWFFLTSRLTSNRMASNSSLTSWGRSIGR